MAFVNVEDIRCNNEKISEGTEGEVYSYDDSNVIKLFNSENLWVYENRLNKLRILTGVKLKGHVFPNDIAYDENNHSKMVGMIMEKISGKNGATADSLEKLGCTICSEYPMSLRIAYLLEEEKLLKAANEKGYYNVDINGSNILIDKDGKLQNIDTVNYAVGIYGPDCYSQYFIHYQNNVNGSLIDENAVKYNFGIYALELLTCSEHIHRTLENDCKLGIGSSTLCSLVKRMDMNKNVKDVFYELFSDTMEKEYIGEILKQLSDEERLCVNIK